LSLRADEFWDDAVWGGLVGSVVFVLLALVLARLFERRA
jgi:hypothetical protein